MKKKIKHFFSLFKFSNLKREVKQIGGEITYSSVISIILIAFVAGFILSSLLKLKLPYLLGILAFFIMCLPYIIILRVRSDYEKARFNDIIEYMEQLIYSFHKSGKINESLTDVYKVSEGHIKECIEKMLEIINGKKLVSDVYREAFTSMQKEYDCSRLSVLHNFLIECEEQGGEHASALNIILEDIRGWSERTQTYQLERKRYRNNVVLSIFLAFLTCGVMVNLIPSEYSALMIANPVYHIATFFCVIFSIIVYIIVQRKTSKSYLDFEMQGDSSSYAINRRKFLENYDKKNHFIPMVIKSVIFIALLTTEWFLNLGLIAIVPTAVVALLVMIHDGLRKNSAVKVVQKELYMQFPQWIRVLSLCLQTDNVHRAIQKSYESCPDIMKPDLEQFIKDLSDDPITVKPYDRFLSQFNVPTLRLSINYLHSASQFGLGDSLAQLDYLIKQNTQLTIDEERIRNANALAGIGLYVYAPMLIAVIKLMVDMVLFLGIFLGLVSSYV